MTKKIVGAAIVVASILILIVSPLAANGGAGAVLFVIGLGLFGLIGGLTLVFKGSSTGSSVSLPTDKIGSAALIGSTSILIILLLTLQHFVFVGFDMIFPTNGTKTSESIISWITTIIYVISPPIIVSEYARGMSKIKVFSRTLVLFVSINLLIGFIQFREFSYWK